MHLDHTVHVLVECVWNLICTLKMCEEQNVTMTFEIKSQSHSENALTSLKKQRGHK